MKSIFKFLLIIIRIFIAYKVITLLSNCSGNYDQTSINKLIWWGVFLIFDIWLQLVLPSSDDDTNNEK